jgi:hypothetical protein
VIKTPYRLYHGATDLHPIPSFQWLAQMPKAIDPVIFTSHEVAELGVSFKIHSRGPIGRRCRQFERKTFDIPSMGAANADFQKISVSGKGCESS